MAALIIKGIIVGVAVVAIGLLAERGKTALAAVLIYLPVFSLGAFWAAASVNRQSLEAVTGKALLAVPVWITWILTIYLILRLTSIPEWLAIAIGLIVWILGMAVYLKLVG